MMKTIYHRDTETQRTTKATSMLACQIEALFVNKRLGMEKISDRFSQCLSVSVVGRFK